jgi:hypothetical protein
VGCVDSVIVVLKLLNRIFRQMGIGLGKLRQFRFVVNVGVGNLEAARFAGNVGLDIADTRDFGQIASDRGGTGPSDHVGDFETDERRRRSVDL